MKLPGDERVRYRAKNGDERIGPCTVEGLESLVYLGRVTPDTMISPEDREEFRPIRYSELALRLFPRLDQPSVPETWAPPEGGDAGERVDRKHYQLGEARFESVNPQPGARGRIEVHDLLHEIRQAEIDSGRDHVPGFRFRISKRSRDFWVMLILGNVVLIGGGIAMQNTSSIVFGFAGSGLYTFGLLWSMYGVMDRY